MQLMAELWRRRVWATLGAFVGAIWLCTEIAGFLVTRYAWDARWQDVVFIGLLSLAPAVLWLAWRIGEEGQTQWRSRDVALVTINLALVALVIVLVWARSGGPHAPNAEVVDPTPIQNRLRIAIAPLDLGAADDLPRWQALLVPLLLHLDLQHDPRLLPSSVFDNAFLEAVRRKGAVDPARTPPAAARAAALDLGMDFLLLGTMQGAADGKRTLRIELYSLQPEARVGDWQVSGSDWWDLADDIGVKVRGALPATGGAKYVDPPARAVTTTSETALIEFINAFEARAGNGDFQRSLEHMDAALVADPKFQTLRFERALLLIKLGRVDEGVVAFDELGRHAAGLPEWQRFNMRAISSMLRNDSAGARRAYEAWSRRFPDDTAPLLALAEQSMEADPSDAGPLDRVRAIVEARGSSQDVLLVAGMMMRRLDFAGADSVLSRGMRRFPEDIRLLSTAANAARDSGDLDRAQRLLLDYDAQRPDRVTAALGLAELAARRGDAAQTSRWERDAQARASTDAQRLEVELAVLDRLQSLGQYAPVVDALPALLKAQLAQSGPLDVVSTHYLRYVVPYAAIHGDAETMDWLEPALSGFDSWAAKLMRSVARANLAGLREDAAALRQAADELEGSWNRVGATPIKVWGDYTRASAAYIERDSPAMVIAFEKTLAQWQRDHAQQLVGTESRAQIWTDAIHAAIDAQDGLRAQAWLSEIESAFPGDPRVRFARAHLAASRGDTKLARSEIDLALARWSAAHPAFAPARHAREFAAELNASGAR